MIQHPIPDDELIQKYYSEYIRIKNDMNPGYLTDSNKNALFLERDRTFNELNHVINNPEAVCCEFGCANGHFLKYLHNKNISNIIGIDISQDMLDTIDKDHFTLIQSGNLKNIETNSIDNLYLFNVLEHVKNPDDFINDVNRITKSNSEIIIEVPLTGIISSLFGKNWRFLMPDEHLAIPSYRGLKTILNKYNIKIISSTRFGSGFTSGSINSSFKTFFDKTAKKLKIGDRGAFLCKKTVS